MSKAHALPEALPRDHAPDRVAAIHRAAEQEGVSPVLLDKVLRLAEDAHGRLRRDGFLEALDATIAEFVREPL